MHGKTQIPCDCGVVSHMLNDPDSGLILSENNSFLLGGSFLVYHCPFCGGRLPDRSKPIWYPQLTQEERTQLEHRIEGITTPEEVIERLGQPDYDAFMRAPENIDVIEDNKALHRDETRNVEYYNLSENVNINFYFSALYGVHFEITIKAISPRHIDSE